VLGTGLGIWVGINLLALYGEFFQFPDLIFQVSWPLVIGAILVSAGAACLGALVAVRGAVSLPPAEAMRPEAPARFKPGILERIGLGRLFSPVGRMVIRTLERQPIRAALSSLAVGLSISILLVGLFMFDAVGFMADFQFRSVQREDLTIIFNAPRAAGVRHELARMEGVSAVETFRSVPVRIRAGHRSRQVAVTGLENGSELRRILGPDGQRYRLPEEGVLLSAKLADMMMLAPGDSLRLEVLEGRQPVRWTVVAGVVDDLFGLNAYMELGALNRMMRDGPTVSGAYLRVDEQRREAVNQRLKEMPAVAAVSSRNALLENFESQTQENLLLSMSIMVLFAMIIAVGVIYNGARIALSERSRELASLRVLGFTRNEVAVILFGEQTTVTAIGIPLGFAIGLLFANLLITGFDNENYRIPLVIDQSTFVFAAGVAVAAALFAGVLVRGRLNRLDLIEVLKTRD
jgi:putative ABC transport system permease protein